MNKVFILFILLFPFSCKKEINTEKLVYDGGKGFKYWLIESNTISDSGIHFFVYFDKNGKWLSFYINPIGKFVENKSPDDVIMNNKWSLLNDSVIMLGGRPFKLIKITEDTMVIYNDRLKEKSVYVVAPENLIPEVYRKLQ
jgi:hypothetical protein